MTLSETILVKLGAQLSKFLLKKYLREPADSLGDQLVDVAKGKIDDYRMRQEARRIFERMGEGIAAQLVPFFEAEHLSQGVNVDAVVDRLSVALAGNLSAEFFVNHDLDATKLIDELRRSHPLPLGQFSEAEKQLYERTLQEAVRYMVELASRLPRFEIVQVGESLRRLSEIVDIVIKIQRDIEAIGEVVHRQAGSSGNVEYEINYRMAVRRNLDHLELFGADLSAESRRHALSVAYVSLTLENNLGGSSLAREQIPVDAVLDGLSEGLGRLLIRGEAGSGKSTLLRWTAIQAARGASDPFGHTANNAWQLKVPFLVRLRDCRGGMLPSPSEFPLMIAKEILSPPAEWVKSVLSKGRGLLLLDGIDEIPNLHRENVRNELEALLGAYPDNIFIVSSRPEAIPADWLRGLGFREARINPMSDVDCALFVDKWHEAVGQELSRVGRPTEDLRQLASDLKREIAESSSVARLTTNPLLCAMVCALHRDRGRKLPESQPELCEALCQVLLHRRELESGLDLSEFPKSYRVLTYPQKRYLVQEIAHYMVLNGQSYILATRATERISEALRLLIGVGGAGEASEICMSLVERSGMLREAKPGHIDFIHNTFKEFLAGDRFANAGDAGLLSRNALDPNWQRVVIFAVSTPRPGFADEVIWQLLDANADELGSTSTRTINWFRRSRNAELLRSRQLVALQCRAFALLKDPILDAELKKVAETMFPPRSMDDAEKLATAGELVAPFLAYRDGLSPEQAMACVRALRLIRTPLARTLLRGYLEDRRESVVYELSHAVNPLTLEAIRERLVAGDPLPLGIRLQISDLSPLPGLLGLRSLNLARAQMSDISPLGSLPELVSLDLSNTPVAKLAPLSSSLCLKELNLAGTAVDDLLPISGLIGLEKLNLSGTRVLDLSPLASLVGLRELNLSSTLVSDVSCLGHLSDLARIDLSLTEVVDTTPLEGIDGLVIDWVFKDRKVMPGLSR